MKPEAICECCAKPIPHAEVLRFRQELFDKKALPACCEDCAELPAKVFDARISARQACEVSEKEEEIALREQRCLALLSSEKSWGGCNVSGCRAPTHVELHVGGKVCETLTLLCKEHAESIRAQLSSLLSAEEGEDCCPECGATDPFRPKTPKCSSCHSAATEDAQAVERKAGWDPTP